MTVRVSRRALLAAPMVMALPARADDAWPKAPVKIIVPAAPGGPTDVMARMVQAGLGATRPARGDRQSRRRWREHRRRAGRKVTGRRLHAVDRVDWVRRQSQPLPDPGYDPFKDFLPITELGSSPNVILVHPSSPITTIKQLIDKAKADKEKLNITNPGQGSTPHLTAELLSSRPASRSRTSPTTVRGPRSRRCSPGPRRSASPPCRRPIRTSSRAPCARSPSRRRNAGSTCPTCRRWRSRAFPASSPRPSRACTRRWERPTRSCSAWPATRSRCWPIRRRWRSCAASASTCGRAAAGPRPAGGARGADVARHHRAVAYRIAVAAQTLGPRRSIGRSGQRRLPQLGHHAAAEDQILPGAIVVEEAGGVGHLPVAARAIDRWHAGGTAARRAGLRR